ncbi:hypothetical protein A3C91_00060 [Candidatus Azambacteria bacterium RIFCSPHIGHO2_02_FULL_52_12]|uniref:DUF5666 domain-containing protein n=1 Tax=Candidatus Azambacteria bacterium RIFCSPLOWO2_01_FULL_46_25 TaxID=1797298 RepID=A0A1F5BUP2_9BACT|nr:MAG: hypothetical protein A3C91_00060 [Candidatus Azambacteria bacterium RIFCSPHIGHO2_02_FULL_52_12]OGD34336.1 MAG: hypothetical protein A2988_02300 [Candidatus Azambacteria bacterium RIFCSPLOWO2_01_FULL_46_25]OGD37386.1 MAG: hypothetical protein A2850_01585 [Candidatus Azambacteria bacterium RIFCSPHIGHO2_01_FULL_51_74]
MNAFVRGTVITENLPVDSIAVLCGNGRIVQVDINDLFEPELPALLGSKVDIEGHTLFSDGEIEVYAHSIMVITGEMGNAVYKSSVLVGEE